MDNVALTSVAKSSLVPSSILYICSLKSPLLYCSKEIFLKHSNGHVSPLMKTPKSMKHEFYPESH